MWRRMAARLRKDRAALSAWLAVAALIFWVVMSLLGDHPDGAILGFSGTLWMLWATGERPSGRKGNREREKR